LVGWEPEGAVAEAEDEDRGDEENEDDIDWSDNGLDPEE
jgi:hypothetical protein